MDDWVSKQIENTGQAQVGDASYPGRFVSFTEWVLKGAWLRQSQRTMERLVRQL
jgi:hypothetical protein